MNIQNLFDNAELAMAAYATLDENMDSSTVIANLQDAGFTLSQASNFSSRYSVVTQYNDDITSFSATVFKDISGNLTVAFKGTLEAGDFLPTDANIAVEGAGYDQIVAMYNWWLRASSPIGNTVPQYQYLNAFNLFIDVPSVSATGELVDALAADPDQKVDVTGHSLGAHLALAFNTLFSTETNEVTGFNTPGFIDSQVNQDFFSELGGEVPTAANSTNVTNVFADEASVGEQPWNAVAGKHFDGNPIGGIINISIEDQALSDEPNPIGGLLGPKNHGQAILTDSLAVYNLLAQLAPSLSTSEYKTILNLSVIGTSGSYEGIVDALQVLFGIDNTPLPTGNNNRNALYLAISEIQSNAGYQSYIGQMQIIPLTENDSAVEFKVKALGLVEPENALAYRYALVNLNPFVITGNDAIYASHNTNEELDLFNSETNEGTLTEQYLEDRAAFLQVLITSNIQDDTDVDINLGEKYQGADFIDLDNISAPIELSNDSSIFSTEKRYVFGSDRDDGRIEGDSENDHLYGGKGFEVLYGLEGDDYIEGNQDDDALVGGEGKDTLLGGKGNDDLYHNDNINLSAEDNAADILKGGKGFDTYFAGFGDVIEDDAMGEGKIYFDGPA